MKKTWHFWWIRAAFSYSSCGQESSTGSVLNDFSGLLSHDAERWLQDQIPNVNRVRVELPLL